MNLKLNKSKHLHTISVGIFSLWIILNSAAACELTTTVKYANSDDIRAFFKSQKKEVITFVGYSGAEYEDKMAMLEKAGRILDEFVASKTIVNIGATAEGIGAVYELAKRRGFMTTGIVSTQAKKYNAALSPCVDYVFYVEDDTWGGFLEGSDLLSPTSRAMVESSDVLIGIGGGEVGRDELLAAKRSGKEVRFIPADMHHQKAREKAQKKGFPAPTSFGGAAGEAFKHQ
jgi:hypothetical protein